MLRTWLASIPAERQRFASALQVGSHFQHPSKMRNSDIQSSSVFLRASLPLPWLGSHDGRHGHVLKDFPFNKPNLASAYITRINPPWALRATRLNSPKYLRSLELLNTEN